MKGHRMTIDDLLYKARTNAHIAAESARVNPETWAHWDDRRRHWEEVADDVARIIGAETNYPDGTARADKCGQ